jgi:hypothetical protein
MRLGYGVEVNLVKVDLRPVRFAISAGNDIDVGKAEGSKGMETKAG